MKTLFLLCCVILLNVAVATADDCVTVDEVVTSWSDAVRRANTGTSGTSNTLLVCDPCSCPSNNGMAGCYEYLAEQERRKVEQHQHAKELINKLKRYGFCK